MKIQIKSAIPIYYEQAEILGLCQSFGLTYVSHEKNDRILILTIVENLNQDMLDSIVANLKNHVIQNLVKGEIITD